MDTSSWRGTYLSTGTLPLHLLLYRCFPINLHGLLRRLAPGSGSSPRSDAPTGESQAAPYWFHVLGYIKKRSKTAAVTCEKRTKRFRSDFISMSYRVPIDFISMSYRVPIDFISMSYRVLPVILSIRTYSHYELGRVCSTRGGDDTIIHNFS
jgi:hypothetical protein